MICSNCQKENRKGSRFCQFCGTPLTEPAPVAEPVVAPVAEPVVEPAVEPVATPAAEPVVEEVIAEAPAQQAPAAEPVPVAAPVKAEKPQKEKKPKGGKPVGLIILSVVMIVLFLASAGLNVYQYTQNTRLKQNREKVSVEMSNLTKEKAELEQTLDDANESIDTLWEMIDDMSAEMSKEAEQLDAYYRLFDCLVYSNLGYFSDEFYTDYALVPLVVGEEDSVILTTAWEGSGTVDLQTDNDCAEVGFAENSWSGQVEITIKANKPGVTIATFTWPEGEGTFAVVILVCEE